MNTWWRLGGLLLALVSSLCWCAVSMASQAVYGQWICQFGESMRLSQGAAQVMVGSINGFHVDKTETLPDGMRLTGTENGGALTLTTTANGGTVHVHGQAAPAATECAYFCTFAGGDLARTNVGMDTATVRLPATREQGEYPHARRYLFFPDQPAKTFGIDIATCNFANLRDFRMDNRDDFQLFIIPDAAGTFDFTIDLTKSTFSKTQDSYDGASLMNTDDLHLPDLSLSRNLVQNPGFEGGLALWGEGVTDMHPSPIPGSGWAVDTTVAHSGQQSARYTIARGYNPPMLCTYPLAVHTGGTYTVSFFARTDTPGAALSLFVQTTEWGQFPLNGPGRYPLTRDWQRFVATFTAPNPFLRLCFGDRWWDGNAEGQLDGAHIWLDDVQCEASATASAFTQKPLFCRATTNCLNECLPLEQPHPALQVTLTNTSDQPARCAADISVRNLARTPLLTQRIQAQLAPWQSIVRTISLQKVQARGLLRVEMAATAGAYRETFYGRFTRYARIPDVGKLRYGVHLEAPDQHAFNFLQSYGVSGSLSFALPPDPAISAAAAARNWLLITGATYEPGCPVKLFTEPMTEAKWQTYDAWLGSKIAPYHDQIYWKTMNEPNCGGYTWTPADNMRVVALMRQHIKALNPRALILTPDPYNASRDGQSWLEQFFQAGGNKLVDVVAIHTYRARPESPDLDHDIRTLIDLKAQYGLAHAPIMFTEGEGESPYALPEIGMSPFEGFYEWRLDLLGLDVGRAEIAAAGEMTRTLLACLKNDEQVKFYLTWRDDVAQHQPYATLGAVNFLLATLRHADFQHEYPIGEQTKTYLFQTPTRQPVVVCWSYDLKIDRGDVPPVQAHMPAPGAGWQLVDFMGNPLTPSVAQGVWSFPVSGLPVYLLGPRGALPAAQRLLEHLQIGENGLHTVALTSRLTSAKEITLTVANQLLRPVSGTLRYGRDGQATATQTLALAAHASAQAVVPLPAPSGTVNSTTLTAEVTESGSVPLHWTQDVRWFTIPPLTHPVTVDGNAEDWRDVPALALTRAANIISYLPNDPWRGVDDLSAHVRFAYRADGLYGYIQVRDDVFSQTHPIETAWQGDSLQLYLDLTGEGRDHPGNGFAGNDESFTIARVDGKALIYRDLTPEWQVAFVKSGLVTDAECAITRTGQVTTYEFKLPLKEIFPLRMQPGTSFGLGLLINDADADGQRRQALTTTPPGTEPFQHPELWPAVILTGE